VIPEGKRAYDEEHELQEEISVCQFFLIKLILLKHLLRRRRISRRLPQTSRNDLVVVEVQIILLMFVGVEVFLEPDNLEVVPHHHGNSGTQAHYENAPLDFAADGVREADVLHGELSLHLM